MEVTDIEMYVRYFKKVVFLNILRIFKSIDFTGRIESDNEELRGYEGCYPVSRMLDSLQISEQDSVLDIGCGKGLFLYYAKRYPFRLISGIDLNAQLVSVARRNMSKLSDTRIDVWHCDARTFGAYDKYNIFFINNPFCKEVLCEVVNRIIDSQRQNMRRITVIYQFPYHLDVFAGLGFMIKADDGVNVILERSVVFDDV